jgi:dihydroorotase-like cyclic amidohydrolase
VVVFDPKTRFTITQKKLHMNVDCTPYEGMNWSDQASFRTL